MKKTRRLKPKWSQKQNTTLLNAQKKLHKTIKKFDKTFTLKKAKQLINSKNTKKLKNIGYSNNTIQKRAEKYLEKHTQLSYTDITKAVSNISRVALLKQWRNDIFNGWEVAQKDKSFKKAFDYLVKINQTIEANNYEIFKNTKILTDIFGRSYTFADLIRPTKDFVSVMRNRLTYIDYYQLKYLADKRNLKRLMDALIIRFNEDPSQIGKFGINISLLNIQGKTTQELVEQFRQVESHVWDKTGMNAGDDTTDYFKIINTYVDSENASPTSIEFVSDQAANYLADLLVSDRQKAIKLIARDLVDYKPIADAILETIETNNANAPKENLGTWYEDLSHDVNSIINTLTKNIKGKK